MKPTYKVYKARAGKYPWFSSTAAQISWCFHKYHYVCTASTLITVTEAFWKHRNFSMFFTVAEKGHAMAAWGRMGPHPGHVRLHASWLKCGLPWPHMAAVWSFLATIVCPCINSPFLAFLWLCFVNSAPTYTDFQLSMRNRMFPCYGLKPKHKACEFLRDAYIIWAISPPSIINHGFINNGMILHPYVVVVDDDNT